MVLLRQLGKVKGSGLEQAWLFDVVWAGPVKVSEPGNEHDGSLLLGPSRPLPQGAGVLPTRNDLLRYLESFWLHTSPGSGCHVEQYNCSRG